MEKRKHPVGVEQRKYPVGVEHYTLFEEIGEGVSAKVHRALCVQWNEIVAIKIIDFERQNADLNSICREVQTMNLVDHPNLLKSHCSFVSDQYLWVVMPYMAGGSCLHILKAAFHDGFEEVAIATVLREVLKGLDYLHQQGHIHRDVKAGNVLIDSHGAIKLGDFGVSACLFDAFDRTRMRNTFVGTPCWMAPEVMEQLNGHDYKADMWSFGITALELAHGHAPFSKYPPMKVLLMTLQNAPPGLDYERDRKFSKSFKQMIASCLVKDPHKRPPPKRLLKHSFFKQARSNEYIARKLLDDLPGLGDRMKALKEKEEDMLAQKKMPDGEKEELSQNEYKRGISDWNFNLEDVKAQASLIIDDDSLFEKDNGGTKYYERQLSSNTNLSHISEIDEDHLDSISNYTRTRSDKSDDDATSMASSNYDQTPQSCSPRPLDSCENNTVEIPHMDIGTKVASTNLVQHVHKKGSSSALSCLAEASPVPKAESEKPIITRSSFDGGTGLTLTDTATIAADNDEGDEKAKPPVIQQKGRFKVTSGNVELEKPITQVSSAPLLHKSHSLQVISQTPNPPHVTPPLDHSPMHDVTPSMFTMLNSFLQTNVTQRESILSMMKQVCTTELNGENHGGSGPSDIVVLEKSMLEAAHVREKDLLNQIAELQLRLICAQEEIQKLKVEIAPVNN